jgi:hypothetical protein
MVKIFNPGPVEIFSSGSAQKISDRVCLKNFEQGPVDPDQIFTQGHDRDEHFSTRVCSKNFKQGLPEKFQLGSAWQKKPGLHQSGTLFSVGPRFRNVVFNQSPVEIFSSESAQKISRRVCLKNFNQGPVDPDHVFNRDHDPG